MLPGKLPGDTAAAVYIQIPPKPEFRFLGAIGVSKESAIFKIFGIGTDSAATNADGDTDAMVDKPPLRQESIQLKEFRQETSH